MPGVSIIQLMMGIKYQSYNLWRKLYKLLQKRTLTMIQVILTQTKTHAYTYIYTSTSNQRTHAHTHIHIQIKNKLIFSEPARKHD